MNIIKQYFYPNKKCLKCGNTCIEEFEYCFNHRLSIQNDIPGCKFIENNKYCNGITNNNLYCNKHKCSHVECTKNVSKMSRYCTYHSNIKCEICNIHIFTGKICESCQKKKILNDIYEDISISLEYRCITHEHDGYCSDPGEITEVEKVITEIYSLPKYFKKGDLIYDNKITMIANNNEKLLYLFAKNQECCKIGSGYCGCETTYTLLRAIIFINKQQQDMLITNSDILSSD